MMYAGYKVVAITPGGRKQYLEILREYVREQPLIDEYHILLNPIDSKGDASKADEAYVSGLRSDDCVILQSASVPDDITHSGDRRRWAIPRLFRFCLDPNTIYIFLSDDIVWMAPDAIERLLEFRTQYEQYFLVFGNVVNTSMCSYFHQQAGYFGGKNGAAIRSYKCRKSTTDPIFAGEVHERFLDALSVKVTPWLLKDFTLNLDQRREIMPLQAFAFYGKECAYFDGIVPTLSTHEWLCSTYCHEWEMWNGFCGTALFSHFAHAEQEAYMLNATNFLEAYKKISPGIANDEVSYVKF